MTRGWSIVLFVFLAIMLFLTWRLPGVYGAAAFIIGFIGFTYSPIPKRYQRPIR